MNPAESMEYNNKLEELQKVIGYSFKNIELLKNAFIHSSFANEHNSKRGNLPIHSNERLEFLGDSVLGFVVASYIYNNLVHSEEGDLTVIRATLVCEKTLAKLAKKINISEVMRMGKGELQGGGNNRPSILADAFESLIAAIYIDGGLENAKKFILSYMIKELKSFEQVAFKDYKTMLQEIVQQNPGEKLSYTLVDEKGPDHDKRFYVEANLNSNVIGKGIGKSKKEAEQQAAKKALSLMGY